MLSMASMATGAPIFSPRTSAPWQTKRAPPSSSTMAMCSGDLKPAGGVWSVVKVTISPTPGSVAGAISTGWWGQYDAGGATTMSQRGHFDAAMVSIIWSGWRLHGSWRGWAGLGAAWLRSTWLGFDSGRPAAWLRSTCGLEEGDPVVGGEAADGVGEGAGGVGDLAAVGAAGELPDALHHLGQARGGQRVTAGLEAARGIDRPPALHRGVAVQRRAPRLAMGHEAEVLERDQLEGRERVVHLGEIDTLGAEPRHGEGLARRHPGGGERRQILAMT